MSAGLFIPLMAHAQSSSEITGRWEFTIQFEEGETDGGTISISGDPGSYSGIFDMASSSVTRKLQNIEYEDGRLTFLVERLYDTIAVDVTISGDRMEGHMIFGEEQVPMEGRRLSEAPGAVIDHAEVISSLNEQTLQQGQKFYEQVCAACHGADGSSNLPTARSFNSDPFKYGSDPYSMWQTITNGAGQMGAQRWLSPEDTYAVIQYIREELVKGSNPDMYFDITDEYLEGLPEPSMSAQQLDQMIKREALSGSQEYG
ncbi:c-type cytochrome, partial [Halalkalibaculum sp. DA384]|uniref:c-type cytochrome n=1 Tax=Halalkalibaculum sp. DA384 TaxID=3373606 RepID=UPI0037547934